MKKVFAKLALRLGGFDRVRKLTLPQVQAMVNSIADEQMFWVRLLGGGETKEAEPVKYQSFSDAFKNMQGDD